MKRNNLVNQLTNWKTEKGLTLIELLIVTAILSLVSLTIYSTFNSGIKIWQRVNRKISEEDLGIFFDKFASDLRNSFKFTGLNFSGRDDIIEFPTLVNSLTLHKRTVGKVIYFYDSGTKILSRKQKDFAQIYNDEEGSIQQLIKNIKSLKFQYYLYDEEKKEYIWQDEWSNEELPLAIKIELGFDDGVQINNFTQTVSIPVSG